MKQGELYRVEAALEQGAGDERATQLLDKAYRRLRAAGMLDRKEIG